MMFTYDYITHFLFSDVGGLFLATFIIVVFLLSRKKRSLPFNLKGKVIYADEGRKSKVFINETYNISAKPDFIIRLPNKELAAVEYKSRDRGIFRSDIAQLKASVIAARSQMNITKAFVVNKSEVREISIGVSTESIYGSIRYYVEAARRIKANPQHIEYSYTNKERQCVTCSVRNACQKPKNVNAA